MCKSYFSKKNINITSALISLGITALVFVISFLFFDVVYAINDDLMIESVLSGSYNGSYPFTYYFSTELGVIIAGLYSICGNSTMVNCQVRWLGIFFIFMYAYCLFILIYRSVTKPEKIQDKVMLAAGSVLAYIFLFLESFVMPHYTLVAGSVGAIGLFLFVTSKNREELGNPISIFLIVYMIRVNVFFMLIPFVAIAFIYMLMREGIKSFKSYLGYILIFASLFFLVFALNNMLFLSEEWKAYKEINDIRTTVYDYTGIAFDDRAMEYYESVNITKDDIELYQSYDILLSRKDVKEDLRLIGEYGNERISEMGTLSRIKDALSVYKYRTFFQGIDAPYNYYYLFLLVFTAGVIIYAKKYWYFLILLFEGAYRSFIWIYLIYKGRYPERVTQSILVMEIMLLLGIVYMTAKDCTALKGGKFHVVLKKGALTLLCLSFILGGIYNIRQLCRDYEIRISDNKSEDVVYSYMYDHPENIYFIDVYATVSHTRYAVKDSEIHNENYMLLGGWIYESPVYKDKLSKVLSYEDGSDKSYSYVADALMEKNNTYIIVKEGVGATKEQLDKWVGKSSVIYDTITSDTGIYNVLCWSN